MKLNYKRTFFVGLAFMSICAFWQVYDNVIPLILKDTFHVRDSYIGIVMAMDNVLALFMLPLFGKLSDKTRTKIGRRMPYILGGTILALLCLAIMPAAQKQNNALLFFIGLGLVLIAMATYRSRLRNMGRGILPPASVTPSSSSEEPAALSAASRSATQAGSLICQNSTATQTAITSPSTRNTAE